MLFDFLYALALPVIVPALAVKSLRTGKYRSGWPARFGRGDPVFPDRSTNAKLLLLHCVSVGELLSVQTLLHQLLAADPHLFIAISTTTDTGTARAHALYADHPRIRPIRFPLDFSFAVNTFLDRLRPDSIALVELETWPNFLAIADRRRIPVALVNGRLSERSFPRYRLIRPLMASMLRRLTFLGIQTPTIADRFLALGAQTEKIEILPTLKYDNAHFTDTMPGQHELAAAMGLSPDHTLFVAGSTAPGEEAPLLTTYLTLQKSHPTLRLAIAPRKPESLPALLAALKERNLTPILRTQRPDSKTVNSEFITHNSEFSSSSVFILDTLGELKKLYTLATFVFIGRSLVKLGGSDMIEAAALAKPCCFGPYTSNFAEVVELLLKENAAVLTPDEPTLTRTLAHWLDHPDQAAAMGRHARQIIQQQRGSTDRYVQKLLELLNLSPTPSPLPKQLTQQPSDRRSPEAHISQNGSDGSLAHKSSDHP